MKKLIFVLLLFVSLGFCAKAQTDFAPIGAKWYYNYTDIYIKIPHYYYNIYESICDTLVDNKKVNKIELSSFDMNSQKLIKGTAYYYFYTSNNKVYLYNKNSKQFSIMYDFNLNKGDTFKEYDFSCCCSPSDKPHIIVNDVRYITINNVKLKQLDYVLKFSTYTDTVTVTERLGNNSWSFIYQPICAPVDCWGCDGIRCYSDSVIGIYHRNEHSYDTIWKEKCDTFYFAVGINKNIKPETISISSNPAHDFVTINSSENIKNIEVYDMVGKRMNVRTQNLMSESYNINVSNFPAGLYFIEIKTSEGIVRKKVVVEK